LNTLVKRMLDPDIDVQIAAAGCLRSIEKNWNPSNHEQWVLFILSINIEHFWTNRNVSIMGGVEICERLVEADCFIPITSILQKVFHYPFHLIPYLIWNKKYTLTNGIVWCVTKGWEHFIQ
jgi:hypothetical protein